MNIALYTHDNIPHSEVYLIQIWDYYCNIKNVRSYPEPRSVNVFYRNDQNDMDDKMCNILHIPFSEVNSITDELIEFYINEFDLIFCDNNSEHSMVFSDRLVELLQYKNVFLIMASFLNKRHQFYEKVISFSEDWINTMTWYHSYRSVMRYDLYENIKRTNKIMYVGGELRSYRKYILDRLPTGLDIKQDLSLVVTTNDIAINDSLTQKFITKCNEMYRVNGNNVVNKRNSSYNYALLDSIDDINNDGVSIVYYIIPEYKTSQCIVYSESSFVNYEIFPTEKTWKCVISKTHWVLFAGCYAYNLLKEHGLRSILELTPYGIDFDFIEDPIQRYDEQMKGIEYLVNNKHIFETTEAKKIIEDNYNAYYQNTPIEILEKHLDDILEKAYDEKIRRVV